MQRKSNLIVIENNKFHFMSGNCSYVIGVNPYGYLENYYFGNRISDIGSLRNRSIDRGHGVKFRGSNGEYADASQFFSEYACFGLGDYREPSLSVTLPNGSRISDLKYCGYSLVKKDLSSALPKTAGGESLEIDLYDEVAKLKVILCYTVYPELSAIVRSTRIVNESDEPISIDRAYSFNLDIPNNQYDMVSLCGAHLRERYIVRDHLTQGVHKIDSKRGISSSQRNPFVALCEKNATEHTGDVFGFSLIYSGSFALNIELSECNTARIQGGINDFDFAWKLESGCSFETPEAVLVYSACGMNGMSQTFHDLFRNYLISPEKVYRRRPIVINNWEGTYFDFDEPKLIAIIDSVKDTGIDTFVLDDGWFGKRNDDKTSLGDWTVNLEKLPKGLRVISDYCHQNKMKFGLWFEPEMISPDSELYRAHPDWAICAPHRTPCLGRHQMVLDITRQEVLDYLKKQISELIETVGIDFMKWDCNRCLTEFYSACLPPEREKEFSHRYVLALYELYRYFEDHYPDVFIEGCASGGGRFDAGILRYSPQIWTSDNSDAYARSMIQYGTSYVYPLSSMSCHVSVCPNHQCGRTTPFQSRQEIAALGAFGYELDTTKLTPTEKDLLREYNRQYLMDEELILRGDLFRLVNPYEENLFAEMIISKDRTCAILTVMVPLAEANKPFDRIRLVGLDEKRHYMCVEEQKCYSASELLNRGFDIPNTHGDFKTMVRHFQVV